MGRGQDSEETQRERGREVECRWEWVVALVIKLAVRANIYDTWRIKSKIIKMAMMIIFSGYLLTNFCLTDKSPLQHSILGLWVTCVKCLWNWPKFSEGKNDVDFANQLIEPSGCCKKDHPRPEIILIKISSNNCISVQKQPRASNCICNETLQYKNKIKILYVPLQNCLHDDCLILFKTIIKGPIKKSVWVKTKMAISKQLHSEQNITVQK